MKFEELAQEKRRKIELYLDLLFQFNGRFNLTSFGDAGEALEKGVGPTLSALVSMSGGRALDIGSGSGIPALPLAICLEETKWTLLEPSPRKAGFLIECGIALGLDLKVVTTTAEEYLPGHFEEFESITVRGVKLKPRTLRIVSGSLTRTGRFFVWTGEEAGGGYSRLLSKAGFDVSSKECEDGMLLTAVPRGTKTP